MLNAMYDPYDFYFKQAKKVWYKARSAFKLDEIQDKFHVIDKNTKTIIDIGCAPGSRLQYSISQMQKLQIKNPKIIWFDLKKVELNLPWVFTYEQDITDQDAVKAILKEHDIEQVDFIQSDMAPNTTGIKDLDAMRSVWLIEQTLRMYQTLLKPDGKFVIKIFMWPGFQEFVLQLKQIYWWSNIKVFKPKSCRRESKETFIIRI